MYVNKHNYEKIKRKENVVQSTTITTKIKTNKEWNSFPITSECSHDATEASIQINTNKHKNTTQ